MNWLATLFRSSERWPAWAYAIFTFALGSLLIALGLTRVWSDPISDRVQSLSPWWFLVPLAVASLAMLARTSRPLLALAVVIIALAIDLLLGGSLGVPIAFFDLLFAAALRTSPRARRVLQWAAVVIIGVPTLVVLVITGSARFSIVVGLQLFLIVGTPLWWASDIRRSTELADLAAKRADDLERISELSRASAVNRERTLMARELHDVVASHLSAIAIRSAAALSAPPSDATTGADSDREALRAIRESALVAHRDLRDLITVLRSGDDELTPMPASLDQLDALFARTVALGTPVALTGSAISDGTIRLDTDAVVAGIVYRIVLEALTNATKHAPGEAVTVTVEGDSTDDTVRVTVQNAVVEAGTSADRGSGLLIMAERAASIGGRFSVDQTEGSWVVRAELPLRVAVA